MDFLIQWFGTTDVTMLVISLIAVGFGLYMAWNIGANDVANAMATSVGSGALTYKQAVLVAAVMEFAGALLAGSHVTDTVRKGIVNVGLFENDPSVMIIGMLAALLAAAVWLNLATLFGLPVSTTHSIVGAIVGFGLIVMGTSAVNWNKIIQIVLSWLISPLAGGGIAYLIFRFIRKHILIVERPGKAVMKLAPFFTGITIGIIVLASIYKGLKNLHLDLPAGKAFFFAFIAGVIGYLIMFIFLRIRSRTHEVTRQSVEPIFTFLQILTAAYVAFAHGANDVANAIGPLAAIIATIQNGVVALKVEVPLWILFMGAFGIVVGLATYGFKVIRTVGAKITELTPTRGFSAEFAAATVVLSFSKLGLPISTTHTLVGGVLGVGLAQGLDAINLKVVRSILGSWLLTLPVAGILAIIFYFLLNMLLPIG